MTDQPPFERIPGQRTRGPRWSETALAEVVAVGTGTHNGQVQIRLYSYDGADEQNAELWARVAVPVAGKDRGAYLVPSKGDEVLVTFVGGDSRLPVILGSLWNGRDTVPETASNANAVERWSFTSPSGTTVTVSETGAADSTVTIDIPDRARAVFTAEGTGKIELSAGGSSMVMDAQGIRFETSGEFCATSATACHSASMVEFDAPLSSFSGVTQCTTSQADTVVGTVYTPGAGNIW